MEADRKDTVTVKKSKEWHCFDGLVQVFTHDSTKTGVPMTFSLYTPPQALAGARVPVIIYLSGLTCTWENFTTKAGAQRYAAEHGVAIVAPDTSPRGAGIPGESDSWDFGVGAGFYVDATAEPWNKNYRMYSYIVDELPSLLRANFSSLDVDNMSVMGHSMGGLGALVCALRNPTIFRTVSAFAPIANPTECPWGKKAFSNYLGHDEASWAAYDPTVLVKSYDGPQLHILIDQGSTDDFLREQLLPDNFVKACGGKTTVEYHLREGYDHSYYFVSTYIGSHIAHHAKALHSAK